MSPVGERSCRPCSYILSASPLSLWPLATHPRCNKAITTPLGSSSCRHNLRLASASSTALVSPFCKTATPAASLNTLPRPARTALAAPPSMGSPSPPSTPPTPSPHYPYHPHKAPIALPLPHP